MSDQPNITLTPRQHRALRHLARRHMHRPRITRRRMFADYTSPPVGTQSIAPDEPAVGASAKLAERVSIPSPPPIYRPTGVANISTPDETVGTQSIAPDEPAVGTQPIASDREEGQPTPDEPAQPAVQAQPIAPDEPPVGADLSSPLPIYRPSGAANISTPSDTIGTQPIAPDKETGQAAHPLPLAYNISPMPSLAELSRPLNAPIPTRDDPRGRPLVPAARKIPPMPPLPMRRASVPVPTQQKHGIISTGQRQYPHYHT